MARKRTRSEITVSPFPGELWLIGPVEGVGPRAIVCVLERDDKHASVVFTDSDIELASDQDVCYAIGEAAPWVVRVTCDLIGPVRMSQFVRQVGAIPEADRADLIEAAGWGEWASSLDVRRGLPLHGPHDTRVAEVDARLEDMWRWWLAPDLD